MASSSFNHPKHRLHTYLQQGRINGFVAATSLGALVFCAITASAYIKSQKVDGSRIKAATAQLVQTRQAVEKTMAERKEQQAKLAQIANAPAAAAALAMNANGITEDDVAYWRKQMDAFSQMTGVRLTIAGRGVSPYKDSAKLTVSVAALSGGAASTLPTSDLVRALDFLQLYGHVESFNGNDVVVHIKKG